MDPSLQVEPRPAEERLGIPKSSFSKSITVFES